MIEKIVCFDTGLVSLSPTTFAQERLFGNSLKMQNILFDHRSWFNEVFLKWLGTNSLYYR